MWPDTLFGFIQKDIAPCKLKFQRERPRLAGSLPLLLSFRVRLGPASVRRDQGLAYGLSGQHTKPLSI